MKMKSKKFLAFVACLLLYANVSYSQWKIYISNDVCMDNSWCLSETRNREYAIDLMAANLDAMRETDSEPWQNRARYTCTVTNEIFYFLEKYPQRRDELIDRIRNGQIMLSPFLVNTNWGFSGVEGFLRSMYPARRFASEYGLPLRHAVHSELPGLPWDIVPLLSGSGITWINKPFLNFDASFNRLKNPPLFILYGPDSSMIKVAMDAQASLRYGYVQATDILKKGSDSESDSSDIQNFWLSHYGSLPAYPLKAVLAEGTHGDMSSRSAAEVESITHRIIDFNKHAGKPVTLINASFPMFADLVDSAELIKPFLPVLKGSFGHTWELWPVGLAKYAAALRLSEYRLVEAEALFAAANINFRTNEKLQSMDRRAEWLLAMFQDHAWNGCDSINKETNKNIRKRYADELVPLIDSMVYEGFKANGLQPDPNTVTLFNPANHKRSSLIEISLQDSSKQNVTIWKGERQLPSQLIVRGKTTSLCFISDSLPGYDFDSYNLRAGKVIPREGAAKLKAVLNKTENSIDIVNSASLERKASIQLQYRSGKSFIRMQIPEIISDGPVATVYRIKGKLPLTDFTLEMIFNKTDGNIDFNILIDKAASYSEEALSLICALPVKSLLHVETTSSVVRPYLAPKGDFLDGADTSRVVMQSFVNAQFPGRGGLILSSSEAFCLNPSDTAIVVELLGNNQNYKEAVKDQGGVIHFEYHFAVSMYDGPYSQVRSQNFGFLKQMPLLISYGRPSEKTGPRVRVLTPGIRVTVYKPADPVFGDGTVLRLWNTSPSNETITIRTDGYKKAWLTDLLEQNIKPLIINDDIVSVSMIANGFAGIRLLR